MTILEIRKERVSTYVEGKWLKIVRFNARAKCTPRFPGGDPRLEARIPERRVLRIEYRPINCQSQSLEVELARLDVGNRSDAEAR